MSLACAHRNRPAVRSSTKRAHHGQEPNPPSRTLAITLHTPICLTSRCRRSRSCGSEEKARLLRFAELCALDVSYSVLC